jgi:4-hydroxybenzoate polyprenyltransferase
MDEYETIKSIISLSPVVIIVVLSVSLINQKWPLRLLIVFVVGWMAIFYSTQMFWDYSFDYAPTEEIKRYVASKDGGPRVGSLYFGWVYVVFIMLLMEGVIFIARKAIKWIYKHNNAN